MTEEQDRPQPHNGPQGGISPAVAAAMAQLGAIRAERGITPRPAVEAAQIDRIAPAVDWQLENAIKLQNGRRAELDRSRYGAARASARLASSQDGPGRPQAAKDEQFPAVSPQSGTQEGFQGANERVEGDPAVEVIRASGPGWAGVGLPAWIRVYPSIVAAAMREDAEARGKGSSSRAAEARLYVLAKEADKARNDGGGAIEVDRLITLFTEEGSPYCIRASRGKGTEPRPMTAIRVKRLLKSGAGVFWEFLTGRGTGRIKLNAPAGVMWALTGGELLTGDKQTIAAAELLGGMQRARAAFWSIWPVARGNESPISRETLRIATGVSPRSQYRYNNPDKTEDRRPLLVERKNTVFYDMPQAPAAYAAALHDLAWSYGHGVFQFIDHMGKLGPRGLRYGGRAISKSYTIRNDGRGPMIGRAARGRQSKENRAIRELLVNSGRARLTDDQKIERRYYDHAAAAVKVHNRRADRELYYRAPGRLTLIPEVNMPARLGAMNLWRPLVPVS